MILFHRDPRESCDDSIKGVRTLDQLATNCRLPSHIQVFNYIVSVLAPSSRVAAITLER